MLSRRNSGINLGLTLILTIHVLFILLVHAILVHPFLYIHILSGNQYEILAQHLWMYMCNSCAVKLNWIELNCYNLLSNWNLFLNMFVSCLAAQSLEQTWSRHIFGAVSLRLSEICEELCVYVIELLLCTQLLHRDNNSPFYSLTKHPVLYSCHVISFWCILPHLSILSSCMPYLPTS